MFELEEYIANWKDALIDDGAINADGKLELESHLRESISALHSNGLSQQEAFSVATSRLGHPFALKQEFVKNNPVGRWRYRLFWMLVGFLGLKAAGGTVAAITAIMGTAFAAGGFTGSVSGIAMTVLTATLWIGVFTIGFRKRQLLGSSGESLPLWWVVALGAILIIAPVVSTFARIAQARLVATSWLGEVAYCSAIGGIALNLCIVAFCFATLWKLNDRDALTLT